MTQQDSVVDARTVAQRLNRSHLEVGLDKDSGALADTGEARVRSLVEGKNVMPVGGLSDDLWSWSTAFW